jgi:small GTP-binding protein
VHTFPNSQISVQGCGDGWNTLIAQRDEMIRNERFTPSAVKTSDGNNSKPSAVYIPQEFTINVSCPATAVPFLFSPNDQNVLGKLFPCFLSNCLTEKMCYSENFQCKVSFFRLEDHFPIIERNILSKWNGKQFIAYAEYFFPEILEYLDSSIYNATPELISPPFIQKNPEFIRKTFIRTQANNFLHSSNEKSHYYPPISEDLIDKMMKELIPLHKICMRIYERIISEFPRPTNLWKARYEAENLEKFYRQKYPHEFKKTDPNYSANDSNSLSFIQATSRLVTAASRIPPLAEMQPSSIIFGRPYALTFSSNPSFSFQPSVAGSIPQSFQQKTSSSKKIASPRDSIKCDVVVKHLLLGESGVGKTKLLLRLAYDKFYPSPLPPTQGVEFKTVRDFQYGKRVKQEISDAAGQSNHRDIVLPYIATAMSILLVYDVTNRSSFEALRNYWIGEIRLRSKSSAVITLVGNKCDCTASERVVSYEDGLQLSRELGCPFYETSAKADIHVALAFHVATNLMLLKIYHPNQRNVEEAMKLLSGGDEEMEEEIRQSVVVIREIGKKTRKAWLCLLL